MMPPGSEGSSRETRALAWFLAEPRLLGQPESTQASRSGATTARPLNVCAGTSPAQPSPKAGLRSHPTAASGRRFEWPILSGRPGRYGKNILQDPMRTGFSWKERSATKSPRPFVPGAARSPPWKVLIRGCPFDVTVH